MWAEIFRQGGRKYQTMPKTADCCYVFTWGFSISYLKIMSHYYALYDKGWVIPENFRLGPFLFSIVTILIGFFFRWPKTPENALHARYFNMFFFG